MRRSRNSRHRIKQALQAQVHRFACVAFLGCAFLLLFDVPALLSASPGFDIKPTQILAFAGFAALAVWTASDERASLPSLAPVLVVVGLWTALAVLNGLFTLPTVGDTARIVVHNHILFLGVLGLFALALGSGKVHTFVTTLLIAAVLIHAGLVLFESMTRIGIRIDSIEQTTGENRFRSAGFFEQPNITAKFLVLGLACTLTAVSRRWALPFFLLVATAVFFTGSRSNLLLLLIVFAMGSRHLLGSRAVVAIGASAVLAGLVFAATQFNVLHSLKDILGNNVSDSAALIIDRIESGVDTFDNSRETRLEASALAWATIGNNPLGGAGVTTFDTYYNQLGITPHNTYAVQGLLFGVPGIVCMALLVGLALLRAPVQGRIFIVSFAASCWFSGENTQELFVAVMLAWVFATPKVSHWHHAPQAVTHPESTRSVRPTRARPTPARAHRNTRAKSRNTEHITDTRRRRRKRVRVDSLGTEDLDNLDL